MTLAVGDRLPDTTFRILTEDGVKTLSTADVFAGKKVVLFAVPGAFTPGCSNNHLPGYLENHDAIKARGIDQIAVVATNDAFVMGAWEKATGAKDKILFLSDGSADFARATGLDADLSANGMGVRIKRCSMVVDDGKVIALNVEPKPGIDVSAASKILEQI
jgi:peroxiredoxin